MRTTQLQRIIELLVLEERLTVPQIQYHLRTIFGIALTQKQIINAVSRHGDKMDVIHEGGHLTVILFPAYRNLLSRTG